MARDWGARPPSVWSRPSSDEQSRPWTQSNHPVGRDSIELAKAHAEKERGRPRTVEVAGGTPQSTGFTGAEQPPKGWGPQKFRQQVPLRAPVPDWIKPGRSSLMDSMRARKTFTNPPKWEARLTLVPGPERPEMLPEPGTLCGTEAVEAAMRNTQQTRTPHGDVWLGTGGGFVAQHDPSQSYRSVGAWFENDLSGPAGSRTHPKAERLMMWPYGQHVTRLYPGEKREGGTGRGVRDQFQLDKGLVYGSIPYYPSNLGKSLPPVHWEKAQASAKWKEKAVPSTPLEREFPNDEGYMRWAMTKAGSAPSLRRKPEWHSRYN